MLPLFLSHLIEYLNGSQCKCMWNVSRTIQCTFHRKNTWYIGSGNDDVSICIHLIRLNSNEIECFQLYSVNAEHGRLVWLKSAIRFIIIIIVARSIWIDDVNEPLHWNNIAFMVVVLVCARHPTIDILYVIAEWLNSNHEI